MNKEEILNELHKSNLDKNRFVIISGAALVLSDVIDETLDIDLACDKDLYDALDWIESIGSAGKKIKSHKCFEISDNFYDNNMKFDVIEGYKLMTLKDILKIKKQLNREKDKEIIKKLEQMIHN